MADRSILVRLRADIADFRSKMGQAAQSADGLAKSSDQAAAKSQVSFASLAKTVGQHQQSISRISTLALGMGAAVGVGVGAAVKTFANFDAQMSNVAATGQDAKVNIDGLRDAAINMGASTAFSASQAAGGIENLLKAGISAKDVMGGGLKGSLDLAAAGQLEVADAAEIAATAMTQFNLAGADVPHIADLLAAGAGKAQGDVADLAGALKQSGLVASQFGLSLEDTVGTLSAFASAGLLGSDAGTSFKTMLLALSNPSAKSADLMKELGIAAYDAQGNFVGVTSLAEQLKQRLSDLTPAQRDAALATIFGNDAIRAANVLYSQGGTGIKGWIDNVNDAGYASETAATKLDNLKGDLEALSGSIETVLIQSGSGANETLRSMAQGATDLVNAIGDIPAPVLKAGVGIAGVSAAALLAVGGISKLAIGAVETRAAFRELGVTSTSVRSKLASINKGAIAAAAAFVAVQVASAGLNRQLEKNAGSVDDTTNALIDLGRGGSQLDKQFAGFGDSFLLLGQGIGDTASAFEALAEAQNPVARGFKAIGDTLGMSSTLGILTKQFDQLDDALVSMDPAAAASAFTKLSEQAAAAGLTLEDQLSIFDDYKAKLVEQANTLKVTNLSAQDYADWMGGKIPPAVAAAAEASRGAGGAIGELGKALSPPTKSFKDLATEATNAANVLLEMSDAEIGVEAAIDDAAASLRESRRAMVARYREQGKSKAAAEKLADADIKSGKAIDINTKAGRANRTALNRLAAQVLRHREQLVAQGKTADQVSAATERGRRKFIASAIQMGYSRTAARKLADALFGIPKDTKAKVSTPGAVLAKVQTKALHTAIKGLPKKTQAEILSIFRRQGIEAAYDALRRIDGKRARTYIETIRISRQSGRSADDRNDKKRRAYGGPIEGSSPHIRADNILIAATAGEFMHQKPSVDYYGLAAMHAINERRIPREVLQGFAYGGPIQAQFRPVSSLSQAAPATVVRVDGRPVEIKQYFPDSMNPLVAATAAPARILQVLEAQGIGG